MKSLSKLLLCLLGFLLPLCLSAQTPQIPQIPQQRAYVANLPAGGRWYAVTNLDLNALDARIASVAGTSAANSPAPSNDFDYVSYNGGWRKLADSPIVSFDSILEANGSATSRTFSVQSGTFADSVTVGSSSLSQASTDALTITAPYGITGIPDPRGGSSPVPYSLFLGTNALMALSVRDARAAAFAQSQFLSNEVVRVETAAALAADLTYPIATNAYANSLLGVAAYPIATNALTQATQALMFSGAVSNQLATHKANGAADHPELATRTYVDNQVAMVDVQESAADAYALASNAYARAESGVLALPIASNALALAQAGGGAYVFATNAQVVASNALVVAMAATNVADFSFANMPTAHWGSTNAVSIGALSSASAAGAFASGYAAWAGDSYSFVFSGITTNPGYYTSAGSGTFSINPLGGFAGFRFGDVPFLTALRTAYKPYRLYDASGVGYLETPSVGYLNAYSGPNTPIFNLWDIETARVAATNAQTLAQRALDTLVNTAPGLAGISNRLSEVDSTLAAVAGTQAVHTVSIAGLMSSNATQVAAVADLVTSNATQVTALGFLVSSNATQVAAISGLLSSNAVRSAEIAALFASNSANVVVLGDVGVTASNALSVAQTAFDRPGTSTGTVVNLIGGVLGTNKVYQIVSTNNQSALGIEGGDLVVSTPGFADENTRLWEIHVGNIYDETNGLRHAAAVYRVVLPYPEVTGDYPALDPEVANVFIEYNRSTPSDPDLNYARVDLAGTFTPMAVFAMFGHYLYPDTIPLGSVSGLATVSPDSYMVKVSKGPSSVATRYSLASYALATNALGVEAITYHNTSAVAHADIRTDIQNITNAISAIGTNKQDTINWSWLPPMGSYHGIALGNQNNNSGQFASAFGSFNSALGFNSMATGYGNIATGEQAFVAGSGNVAAGLNAIALGSQNTAAGQAAVALGSGATAGSTGSFTWNGSGMVGHPYSDHGPFTFNVAADPGSVYFGEKTLADLIYNSVTNTAFTRAQWNYELYTGYMDYLCGYNPYVTGMFGNQVSYDNGAFYPTRYQANWGGSGDLWFYGSTYYNPNSDEWVYEPLGTYSRAATGPGLFWPPPEPSTAYVAPTLPAVSSRPKGWAQGWGAVAIGDDSRAYGLRTLAKGSASNSEGWGTIAAGNYTHAEGESTVASGTASHSEGFNTTASGLASHAEGNYSHAAGEGSHAEGWTGRAQGNYSHAEGVSTTAVGDGSHTEGKMTTADGQWSHAEGFYTRTYAAYAHAEGDTTTAAGHASHAEGELTIALGRGSHAEGFTTHATGDYSHAEGHLTVAGGYGSHAEGYNAHSTNAYAFTWSHRNPSVYGPQSYGSHGDGTFNVNPLGGLSGFYVGEKSLQELIGTTSSGTALFSTNGQTFVTVDGTNVDVWGVTTTYAGAKWYWSNTDIIDEATTNLLLAASTGNLDASLPYPLVLGMYSTMDYLETQINSGNFYMALLSYQGFTRSVIGGDPVTGAFAFSSQDLAGSFEYTPVPYYTVVTNHITRLATTNDINQLVGPVASDVSNLFASNATVRADLNAKLATNDNTSQVIYGLFQSNSVVKTAVDYLAETQSVHTTSIDGLLVSNATVRTILDIHTAALGTNEAATLANTQAIDYKPVTNFYSSPTTTVAVTSAMKIYRVYVTNSTTLVFDTSALDVTNQAAPFEVWVTQESTNTSVTWPSTNTLRYTTLPTAITADGQTTQAALRKWYDVFLTNEVTECNVYQVR